MSAINTYRIIRRAFGQYTTVDVVETTWSAAMNIADMMTTYSADGEYDIRLPGEADGRDGANNLCPVQRAFAYL